MEKSLIREGRQRTESKVPGIDGIRERDDKKEEGSQPGEQREGH
jgi:hypothetical protein